MKRRNEAACPCGSGKGYKECCLPAHIARGRENLARAFNEEVRELVSARQFDSLEAMNEFVRLYIEKRNTAPQEDFLGLSADQVELMLDFPLEGTDRLLRPNSDLGSDDLAGIPVVEDSLRLLKAVAKAEPLKLTAAGYLPRELAKQLFDDIDHSRWKKYIKFRSEADSMPLQSLRLILTMGGWLNKRKGYLWLTKRGRRAAEAGFTGADYVELLWTYTRKFSWKFQDRYPDFDIIQRSFLFGLYLIHKKSREFMTDIDLAPHFVRAFPVVLREEALASDDPYWIFDFTFSARFLERFCAYFGLIQTKKFGKDPYDRRFYFKTSGIFDKLLAWKI